MLVEIAVNARVSNEKRFLISRSHSLPVMRDRRDSQKRRFIETLASQGTVSTAADAAGVSRNTAYRWRQDDREFAYDWDEAIENAVDAVESVLYQKALRGDTIAMIFYLKAHRPIYRDRLNIDIKQVQGEIEERIAQLTANPDLLAGTIPMLTE